MGDYSMVELYEHNVDRLNMTWEDKYELAKTYYEHYENLNIPRDFKTKNGIDYDGYGFPLGTWISNQKMAYKGQGRGKLTQKQIEKLESIGMICYSHDYKWNKMYELAKKYYEHYGNLDVPQNFKTKNGIDYDAEGLLLGVWLRTQRETYKGQGRGKLTQKQIEKLESIGMIWDIYDYKWNKMYELAKKYYEHYGNLNVPQNFKTVNGIDYDAYGFPLGMWISNQRNVYKGIKMVKRTPEQIKKLESIGMIWFSSDRIDEKSQRKIIDESNKQKKQIEILNRFYSLLSHYDDSDLPDKEMMNQDFINQLDHKSLHLVKK